MTASCRSFLRAVWTVIPRAAATALAASPVRRSSGEATNKPHTVVSTSCSGLSDRLNSGWPSRIACCGSTGSSPGCVPIAEGSLLIAELSWLGSVATRSASVKSPSSSSGASRLTTRGGCPAQDSSSLNDKVASQMEAADRTSLAKGEVGI